MKVYNSETLIIDTSMDISYINLENIIYGLDSIMLLYEDREFQTAIASLFDDVVRESELSWKIPDYENSKVYFYISKHHTSLSLEVLPKHFSIQEKQAMLQAVSHEEMANGWSEYLKLMNMFDDIDEILNCSCPVGEVGVYSLELTNDEKDVLFSLIKIE